MRTDNEQSETLNPNDATVRSEIRIRLLGGFIAFVTITTITVFTKPHVSHGLVDDILTFLGNLLNRLAAPAAIE